MTIADPAHASPRKRKTTWIKMVGRTSMLLLLGVGCLPRPAPAPPAQTEVAQIERQAAQFLSAHVASAWEQWIGRPPRPRDLPETETLFSPATIDVLRRAMRAEPDPEARRALHHLHALLVSEYLRRQTATLDRARFDLMRTPLPEPGLTLLSLRQALAQEAMPERRQQLVNAAQQQLEQLFRVNQERQAELDRVAARLGYTTRLQLWSELRQYDVRGTQTLAETVLDETDAVYELLLQELSLTETGRPAGRLTLADLPRLIAGSRYAEAFPGTRLLDVTEQTLTGLGLASETWPAHLDALPTLDKNPRAACFPVRIPDDIRLSVKPTGGPRDYAEFLHEVGHALHFAHTRTAAPALAALGDASTSEALAFVFEGLLDDPRWLHQRLAFPVATLPSYNRWRALQRLMMVRRQAALVLDGVRQAQNLNLPSELQRAYGLKLPTTALLLATLEEEPFLEAADYLRGYVLAATLLVELRKTSGPCWWSSPASLTLLQQHWQHGLALSAEEQQTLMGAHPLDPTALARELAAQLVFAPSSSEAPTCESVAR